MATDPVAGLGMSLDDIIASKKSETGGGGRGRGRGGFRGRGGGGGDRGGGRFGAGGRGGGHLGARPMSASGGGISKASSAPANVRVIIPNQAASHQQQVQGQQGQGGFEGSELRVTNLAFKVTEADVRELFSAIGRLRRTAVDRRPNGESAGAASVAYYNAADCDRAIRTYDGVALDGRPMRVVRVGAGGGVRALSSGLQLGGQGSRRVVIAGGGGGGGDGGGGGGGRVVSVMRTTGGSRGGGGGGGSSRGGGGGGRGGGRVRANVTKLDAAELDAQLDTYMKGA